MREFGLIGKNIGHSFSAGYFNDRFKREGIEARYSLFELADISELTDLLKARPLLCGLNVTSPYKREVIPFLDSLSYKAHSLQAVNVIKIIRGAEGGILLKGYNTDCPGFAQTLPSLGEVDAALVMGTGGAASAVAMALEESDIPYHLVSRNPKGSQIGSKDMNPLLPRCHLIVNATPVGMHPAAERFPDIDYSLLTPGHICYDLIYTPPQTEFLKRAEMWGAATKNGLDMLINQAAGSWEIWNNG